jgi:hypothetical protein
MKGVPMLRIFTAWRRQTLLAVALASAALFIPVASAPAGNAGATRPAATPSQLEQLGPKYLLGRGSSRPRPAKTAIRAMLVNEFGPKYLLGYELKAAG